MVEEGTWVWIDINSSGLFQSSMPKNMVASLFVNCDAYLVIANYSKKTADVVTTDNYVSITNPNTQSQTNWSLGGRSMQILKLVSAASE